MNSWSPSPSFDEFLDLEANDFTLFDASQADNLLEDTCISNFVGIMAESYLPVAASGLHEQLQRYKNRNTDDWTGEDCFDWAFTTIRDSCLHPNGQESDCGIGAFKLTTGLEMLGYTEQDFISLIDPYNGPYFYEKFRETVLNRQQENLLSSDQSSLTTLTNMKWQFSDHNYPTPTQESIKNFPDYEDDLHLKVDYRSQDLLNSSFDNSLDELPDKLNQYGEYSYNCEESGASNSSSAIYCHSPFEKNLQDLNLDDCVVNDIFDTVQDESNYSCDSDHATNTPDVAGDCLTSQHWFKKMPTGGPRKKRVRSPKCWEFLLRLLQDDRTNPRLVEWENYDEGIFRLKQKEIIARMWGSRSGTNEEPLTYESFARLLRHHYLSKCLLPVREKQMVYKFGPVVLEEIKRGKKW